MGERTIDRQQVRRMLHAGKTVSEIAKKLGVTDSAISKIKSAVKINACKVVALEGGAKTYEKSLNTLAQLVDINRTAKDLLEKYLSGLDDEDSIMRRENKQIVMQLLAEIRQQLKLSVDIYQTVYDMTAIADFQKEVLEAIKEAAPDVRERIVKSLRAKQAIRGAIDGS